MNAPEIGIFAARKDMADMEHSVIRTLYSQAVLQNGGYPFILPYTEDFRSVRKAMDSCQGFIIPGGVDIEPEYYGEYARKELGETDSLLDQIEMMALFYLTGKNKPVFGICRGCQMMNVYGGGTLYQDLPSQAKSDICHRQAGDGIIAAHTVEVMPETLLKSVVKADKLHVNSFHHQAIRELAPEYICSAKADDGIIEAIEDKSGLRIAVQWHPEEFCGSVPEMNSLFGYLIEKASKV